MKSILFIVALISCSLSTGAPQEEPARPTKLAFMPSEAEVQGQVRAFEEQSLRAMSYNIRLNTDSDGENAWPKRREFLANQILFHAPQVLGIQEGLPEQVDWLDERLSAYSKIGQGRRGGHQGEYSAIYYDRSQLSVQASGTFWLSETPQSVSTGWDAALPRICTWAHFQRLSDQQEFYVFNTHFDHVGEQARQESARLILEQMQTLNTNDAPAILMGDLNLRPEEAPIRTFANTLQDAFTRAETRLGPATTFSGFNYNYAEAGERRIDYLFASSEWKIWKFATLTDAVDGRFASDHFPVLAILGLPD